MNVSLLFALILTTAASAKTDEIKDYYWREYNGVVPNDAIPGGVDKLGNPSYIGQVYIDKVGLFPGTIYKDSKKIRALYQKEISTEKHVKILCGKNKDLYEWIPMKSDQTHLLTRCQLIVAGCEAGHDLTIGRANHQLEVMVGKALGSATPWPGLWLPADINNQFNYKTYEILGYNCKMNTQVCTNSTLDARIVPLAV